MCVQVSSVLYLYLITMDYHLLDVLNIAYIHFLTDFDVVLITTVTLFALFI